MYTYVCTYLVQCCPDTAWPLWYTNSCSSPVSIMGKILSQLPGKGTAIRLHSKWWMCEAGGQNRVHQGITQAANASPQLGWHSCAPSPWSHAQLHTASHRGSPESHSILKPVLTGQRYFKPRGVTPDRLRSVLWELAEGRRYFNLYTFYQNNL